MVCCVPEFFLVLLGLVCELETLFKSSGICIDFVGGMRRVGRVFVTRSGLRG